MDTASHPRTDFRDTNTTEQNPLSHSHQYHQPSTYNPTTTTPSSLPLQSFPQNTQPRNHALQLAYPPAPLHSTVQSQPRDLSRSTAMPSSAPLSRVPSKPLSNPFPSTDIMLRHQPSHPHPHTPSNVTLSSQPPQSSFTHHNHPKSLTLPTPVPSYSPATPSQKRQSLSRELPPPPLTHTTSQITAPSTVTRSTPLSTTQKHFPLASSLSTMPTSTPLSGLQPKPEPFPYSKTLPFPIPQHPAHTSTIPSTTPKTSNSNLSPNQNTSTAPASTTHPVVQTKPPTAASQPAPISSADRTNTTTNNGTPQEHGPLYDIAKLISSHCTIICGKVYNDKGHNICGVLNQHDKPCKRIGKCPFHGAHRPVTRENSINGLVDAGGTVQTPITSPGANSPPGHPFMYNTRSPGGSDTTVNVTEPKVPPKQQYKHGWSKEEHYLFLAGLTQHGRGSWKQIASVVKTRTPTQVQSHAQKFFQRQKQADKNKRSIHDLSLDSPEMIEVAKKFKFTHKRIGLQTVNLGDNLKMSAIAADPSALRPSPVPIGQHSTLNINHAPLHDTRNAGVMTDAGLGRLGGSINTTLVPSFANGQPTSATTLGSNLSSVVHMPHALPGVGHARSFHPNSTTMPQQHDLLGSLHHHQGNIAHMHHKRPSDILLPPVKVENIHGRDAIFSAIRPAFLPDTYPSAVNHIMPSQQILPGKEATYVGQQQKNPTTLSLPQMNDQHANVHTEHTVANGQYSARGLQSLYPQMGGHMAGSNTVFTHHQKAANDPQLGSWYDQSVRTQQHRRDHIPNAPKDAFGLQTTQLGTTLQNIGVISLPDNIGPAPVMTNEHHQVEQSFDPAQQNQTSAFTGGLFVGTENVDVDPHMYNVGATTQNHVTHFSNAINGFPASAGLPMGQVPMRGPGAFATNHRTA